MPAEKPRDKTIRDHLQEQGEGIAYLKGKMDALHEHSKECTERCLGKEGKGGLVDRVGSLETKVKWGLGLISATFTAVIGATIAAVKMFFFSKFTGGGSV